MSAEPQREFIDTNILVYAHDTAAGEKRNVSRRLIHDLWMNGLGCVSIQVLQEFYSNITRKVRRPLAHETARRRILNLSQWLVHSPTSLDVLEAIDLHSDSHISFWDAMIVVSAKRLNCGVLWSEDLNDGQVIEGVTVRNPFADRTA
jgi:predicted nucleic acid-binding protein